MPRRSLLTAPPAAALLAVAATAAPASAGSVETGRELFQKQCAVCHAVAPEHHKEGPSLAGFYGRRAGTAPFFTAYKSLKGANFVWDDSSLDAWLADPRGFVGGKDTGMTLKVDDPGQRAALIAYMRTLR
jgi:cytochrome c2